MSGRWPPPGRGPSRTTPDPYEAQFADIARAVGDLTGAIARIAPRVLSQRLVQLDANGQANGQSRVPFEAIAVTSYSSATLTVAATPLTASAPGPGNGVVRIPPQGFRLFNARAYAWSVYGGNAGDLVSVETFAVPQTPAATPGNQAVTGTVSQASDYPAGASPVSAASGNQANANAVATLPAVAGRTNYLTGFECTAAGSTGALVVLVTVTGILGGTLTYIFTFPAGATLAAQPLTIEFPKPIPATGPNVAIVVTLPAGGLGNTNAAAVAHGYLL